MDNRHGALSIKSDEVSIKPIPGTNTFTHMIELPDYVGCVVEVISTSGEDTFARIKFNYDLLSRLLTIIWVGEQYRDYRIEFLYSDKYLREQKLKGLLD